MSKENGNFNSANEGQNSGECIELHRKLYNQKVFDAEFGYVQNFEPSLREKLKHLAGSCRCSPQWWKNAILGFFPIISWLPRYKLKQNLFRDFVAGITVGIVHIPQAMAYAGLAGLAPVYGLYIAFFPPIFYMIFGTSHHVSHGSSAILSLMTGSVRDRLLPDAGLPQTQSNNGTELVNETVSNCLSGSSLDPSMDPILILTVLAMATGIFQILMGILHLGFVSAYLSDQVVCGFTTAAAFYVITSQISKIFGVNIQRHNQLGKQFYIIVVTAVSHFAKLQSKYGVAVVDNIPTGLPTPIMPDMSLFQFIWGDAISIAVVAVGVNLSLAKLFAKKHGYRVDPSQSIWLGTFLATACLDVREGLMIGVMLAILSVVFRTQWPKSSIMGNLPLTELYRDASRYGRETITVANNTGTNDPDTSAEDALIKKSGNEAGKHPPGYPDHVILDCSGFSFVDSQGLNCLTEVCEELEQIGIELILAQCRSYVRELMTITGFMDTLPPTKIYVTVEDAVTAVRGGHSGPEVDMQALGRLRTLTRFDSTVDAD